MARSRAAIGSKHLPIPRVVRQLEHASIGFMDRGHGHGDFCVFIKPPDTLLYPPPTLLAEIHGGTLKTAPNDLTIRQLVDQGFVVSDRSVAALFAASPNLYLACAEAYHALARTRGLKDPLVQQLAKALGNAASPDGST